MSRRRGSELIGGGIGALLGRAILWIWSGLTIFSFIWVGITSLKTNREFFKDIWSFPQVAQWDNYARAWKVAKLGEYFLNSIVVTGATVVVLLLVGSMAAYILSRFSFRLNRVILYFFLAGMGVPVQLLLIPLYFLLKDLGLYDSLVGLWLVYIATSLPFTIFVLTGFFSTIPIELEEAGAIDGCTDARIFWYVTLPLASPGLLTVGILNALSIWNEYLVAMAMIKSAARRTLPVGLYAMQVTMQYTTDWTALFAGFIISLLPSALLFLVLQRFVDTGLTVGALKE
jgi:ABC-type glycerol-3-phosphate transport system permease component